jgi:hypothetical protein
MSRERLTNEYHALRFIAEQATIPVPKPLRLEDVDGCLALTTEWVNGVPFDDLDPQIRSTSYLDDYSNYRTPSAQCIDIAYLWHHPRSGITTHFNGRLHIPVAPQRLNRGTCGREPL